MNRVLPTLCLLLSAAVYAQDDELPPGEPSKPVDAKPAEAEEAMDPEVRLTLSKALRKLRASEEVVARANVEHEQAPAAPGAAAGGAVRRVFVMGGAMGLGQPFEGDVEAWRTSDGSVVVVSREEMPGFAMHVKEGRMIQRMTFDDHPVNVDQLKAELTALVDTERLARHLLAAKLTATPDEATGVIVFRGKVSKEVVDPMTGRNPMGLKRVLDAEVELTVKDGAVTSAKIKVIHADPMQAMAGRIQVRLGAGGAPQIIPAGKGGAKEHDKPTGWTTYTLTFTDEKPSDRAQAFKRHVDRVLTK